MPCAEMVQQHLGRFLAEITASSSSRNGKEGKRKARETGTLLVGALATRLRCGADSPSGFIGPPPPPRPVEHQGSPLPSPPMEELMIPGARAALQAALQDPGVRPPPGNRHAPADRLKPINLLRVGGDHGRGVRGRGGQ